MLWYVYVCVCFDSRTFEFNSGFWQVDTVGTAVCLWMYFVLKLVQEAFQTVAPLFAAYAFQWNDEGKPNRFLCFFLMFVHC